jgi:hypothetical protein
MLNDQATVTWDSVRGNFIVQAEVPSPEISNPIVQVKCKVCGAMVTMSSNRRYYHWLRCPFTDLV